MKRSEVGFNVLVLLLVLLPAAVLQDGIRPVAWGQVKLPFLTAAAAYYAMLRPWWIAVPALVLAGVLRDGLSSASTPGMALVGMAGMALFCAVWGRRQLPENNLSCVVVAAGAVFLLGVLEGWVLRWSGRSTGLPWATVGMRVVLTTLCAVPVTWVTAAWAARLDRWVLNTRTENDGDGFEWSDGSV